MSRSLKSKGLPSIVAFGLFMFAPAAWAEDLIEAEDAPEPAVAAGAESPTTEAPPAPQLPDFGGPLWSRKYFTGDWGGLRPSLALGGITFDGNVTQYYQGVTSGGANTAFRYGGHNDYVINLDSEKLGGPRGLFVKLRGETQFGEFINRDVGSLLAANTSGLIPHGEEHVTALTNVLFTQFLSQNFAVFGGKLDTFDGDANAFAHGRGKMQFMNVAFAANPAMFRMAPYSTLGGGFVILHELQPIFTFSVLESVDRSTTFGLDDFAEEGVTLAPELRLPTSFFGMPGHQLFGAAWSGRNVGLLDQNFRILLPPPFGIPPERASDTWALYYNFDQFLVVDSNDPTRGWGVFGRAAIADDDTNPVEWFLSAGLGGNSPVCCRESDTWGVGYYHAGSSDEIPSALNINDGDGVEMFYNIEVTPSFHVTLDLQVINPGFDGIPALGLDGPDTAVVFGIRSKLDF